MKKAHIDKSLSGLDLVTGELYKYASPSSLVLRNCMTALIKVVSGMLEDMTPDPENVAPTPPKRPVAVTADDLRGLPLESIIIDAKGNIRVQISPHTWMSPVLGYLRTFEVPVPARIIYNPEKD